jgi:hypothetical protein
MRKTQITDKMSNANEVTSRFKTALSSVTNFVNKGQNVIIRNRVKSANFFLLVCPYLKQFFLSLPPAVKALCHVR